jgi:hypothetical protein
MIEKVSASGKMLCPGKHEYCKGDDCMAWRWSPKNLGWIDPELRGYCGLAGVPQEAAVPEAK